MLTIDLQLFAGSRFHPEGFDEENPLLQEEVPAEEVPVEEVPVEEVPVEDIPGNAPQAGQPVGQPVGQPQAPLPDTPNPGEDIHAYLERMREDIVSRLPEKEQQQEGPTKEDMVAQSEEWLEQFYEEPMSQVEALAEKIVNQKMEPILKEREAFHQQQAVQENIEQFKKKHPDMEEFSQDMIQIFNERPELETHPHALEFAYKMAKGQRYDTVPKTLDDYMKDEDAINKLLEQPEIKKKMVQKLMNEKQDSPPVMGTGGNATGNAALANPNEITDLRQGTKAWLASLPD